MANFLKSVSNILTIGITIISVIALFIKIDPIILLISLSGILIIAFISLAIYHFNRLEDKIEKIENTIKRTEDLINIKADIINIKDKLK